MPRGLVGRGSQGSRRLRHRPRDDDDPEETDTMAKTDAKAQRKVAQVMHEFKQGELRSSAGQKVTNPKQAVAIGLSEAREAGAKVPPRKPAKKAAGTGAKKAVAKKTAAKKTAAKKTAAKKAR
jgi:hypothetical protein